MAETVSVPSMAVRGTAFLKAVKEKLGAQSNADLYRALDKEFSESRISRWSTGPYEPNYRAAMVMLEKCGWLTEEATVRLAQAETGGGAQALSQAQPDVLPTEGSQERRREIEGT